MESRQSPHWSYPVFTDGWFLWLMVSECGFFRLPHSGERGNVRA